MQGCLVATLSLSWRFWSLASWFKKFSSQGEECLASGERRSGALRPVAQLRGQKATREPILPARVSRGSTPCASRPGAVFEGVHNRVVNIQGLRSFSCLFCHNPLNCLEQQVESRRRCRRRGDPGSVMVQATRQRGENGDKLFEKRGTWAVENVGAIF
ncbi:uncharacterized protein J3D65DRAFT_116292 [Phyllosticta citribraziliensis]|uniref:Secreted protein n=1 Tax=Phyllosticta citribraziliensis TaxID=989973 RepID=A0ABR1LA28_9PEZI